MNFKNGYLTPGYSSPVQADTDHYLRNELFQLQAHIDPATDEHKRPSGDGNTIVLTLNAIYKVTLPGGAEAIIRQTVKVSTNLFTELDNLGDTYILVRRAPLTGGAYTSEDIVDIWMGTQWAMEADPNAVFVTDH